MRTNQQAPWFLHLSILQPHPPFAATEPYNKMYDADQVPPFRGLADPEKEAALHPYVGYYRRHFREREGHNLTNAAEDDRARRQLRATYYGMMTEVDDSLGRLFAAMKAAGNYDDTLIVFTTDHAEMLWDHWILGKEAFFDGAFHIPLIIRVPGKGGNRGRTVEQFTGGIDIMPTILEHLGAVPPLQCDGRSLTSFLQGKMPADWPEEVFWELDYRDAGSDRPEREPGVRLDECSIAVIRDRRFKYVHCGGLPPLLFDLADDPDETKNRAADPSYAQHTLAMAQRMLNWRLNKADRTLTGIRLSRNGPIECPRERRFPSNV